MYANFVSSEFKKWTRDPLMGFMMFYPVLFGLIGRYVLPIIAENTGFKPEVYADVILAILALITPMIYGALTGFSILDDRDDHILTSIRVTPMSLHQFLSFRMILVFVLSFIATIFIMWFSDIGDLSIGNIVAIAFLSALSAPMSGLFINAFAQNKIEGFAVMKGTGITIILPVIALFFVDKKEFFFSFVPGFWSAKAISALVRGDGVLNLTYNQYYFIGLIYVILLNFAVYKLFLQRTKI